MGARGPAPKRQANRIRRNTDYAEVTEGKAGEGHPSPYEADENWHPIALAFYESLSSSGQSRWYEESDWAKAYFLCEAMSRELKPQFIGMQTDENGATTPLAGIVPIKGASLNAINAYMTSLLVTEADRRRSSIELTKAAAEAEGPSAAETAVASLAAHLKKKAKA